MASVRRKKNSQFYYACFRNEAGEQKHASTKETNKKNAQRIADDWESAWRKNITTNQARGVLNGILKLVGEDTIETHSLGEVLEAWMKEKHSEVSIGTRDQYGSVIKNLKAHFGTTMEKDIRAIRREDIVRLRDALFQKVSAVSTNKHLDLLRMVFGYAHRRGFVETSPLLDVNPVAEAVASNSVRRAFTSDEIRRLLQFATPLWRGLILSGLYLGQRMGDIARLTWGQMQNMADGKADYWVFSIRTRKTKRQVIIPIAPPLLAFLLEIRPRDTTPNQPIFPDALKLLDKKGRVQRLSGQFYDLLVRAGLAAKRSKTNTGNGHARRRAVNELSFHSLRHSATSMLKAAGVPQAVVMDIIGHESSAISRAYTHIDESTKADALTRIEDVTKV